MPYWLGEGANEIPQSKDESLVGFYENVRRQVELDKRAGGKYRLAGDGVRQYADKLREEIDRRRLQVEPIDWELDGFEMSNVQMVT